MLDVLRSIVQAVNSARGFQDALRVIVERVRDALETDVCSIYLRDPQDGRYIFMATQGLNDAMTGRLSLGPDEGLVSLVGERSEPVNLDDATLHPRFHYLPEIGEEPFHAFLGVPLIHQRRVLGVLIIQQRDIRRFDASEEAFLVTLSAQLAGVVAHADATGAIKRLQHADVVIENERFRGVPGSPGVAMGVAVGMAPPADLDAVPDRPCEDIMVELLVFERAIQAVRDDIQMVRAELAGSLPPEEQLLFDAYLHMLDDNALAGEIAAVIRQGQWAQGALRRVIAQHVQTFERMEDSYLRERGSDVRELGQRVLAYLQDVRRKKAHFPNNVILVAEDVTPAMLGEIPNGKLRGVVSMRGSGSSHVSILCRAMDVPAVMGAVDLPAHDVENAELIVDGFQGEVWASPSADLRERYEALRADQELFAEELAHLKDLPAQTPDGAVMPLWVNVGLSADVAMGLERGAEGIGLYRTEIPFMSGEQFPTEDEQVTLYRRHLEAFEPRGVTMRTLDIGGDKALSYFPIKEENPFLGWRGIRVTLDHPEILAVQVRAMIRANVGLKGKLRIMLPMITNISEVDEGTALIRRCFHELQDERVPVVMPQIGVMIEVPAAVYQARALARRCDFVAVGSNDLTQYMLAVDRNNPRVAGLYQDLHPAVLTALQDVANAAHMEKKTVSICGELAGNPIGAVLLLAMGYDILSMNATNLLRVKWVLRQITLKKARALLAGALSCDSADEVQAHVQAALMHAGLSRVINPSAAAVAGSEALPVV